MKYEVAISNKTHAPVHVAGPFAGPTGDITIFRSGLKRKMKRRGWFGLADGTYQGENLYLLVPPRPYSLTSFCGAKTACRRRAKKRGFVEVFFLRVKKFGAFSHRFAAFPCQKSFCLSFCCSTCCH